VPAPSRFHARPAAAGSSSAPDDTSHQAPESLFAALELAEGANLKYKTDKQSGARDEGGRGAQRPIEVCGTSALRSSPSMPSAFCSVAV
jgi:hypothetical protein